MSTSAALLRLTGSISNAMFNESKLDELVRKAERSGYADEANEACEVGANQADKLLKK